MAFILNRRAKLRASAIPTEIPDGTTLVKKTDKASASKLGLVKIGDNVNISSAGAISVSDASSETKGLIKLGSGLSINAETGAVDAEGGGMTWTKLFEGAVSASGSETFAEGVDALDHKLMILQTIHDNGVTGNGVCALDIVPAATNTIKVSLARSTTLYEITVSRTGFTFPANMSANNCIIYVLD